MTARRVRGTAAIRAVFEGRPSGKAALIGYLTTGFPDEQRFLRCVDAALDAGVDILELGVPFSDPVADGPMIQESSERALRNGVSLTRTLEFVERIRVRHAQPILLMSYLNPIYRFGFDRFLGSAVEAGVDGVIIPDLIPDEADRYRAEALRQDFALVFLAASNGSQARLRESFLATTGFLYALALEGITGERERIDPGAAIFLDRVEKTRRDLAAEGHAPAPVAVGFGVSRPEHYAELSGRVDGVIVGSALVRRSAQSSDELARFIRELKGDE